MPTVQVNVAQAGLNIEATSDERRVAQSGVNVEATSDQRRIAQFGLMVEVYQLVTTAPSLFCQVM